MAPLEPLRPIDWYNEQRRRGGHNQKKMDSRKKAAEEPQGVQAQARAEKRRTEAASVEGSTVLKPTASRTSFWSGQHLHLENAKSKRQVTW